MNHTVRDQETRWLAILATVAISLSRLGCATGALPESNPNNNSGDSTTPATISFSQQVLPIFTVQCSGCHSPGGIADVAGIPSHLTADVAFVSVVNKPSVQDATFTLVVPGSADASLLFQKISQDNPPIGLRMPRFAPPLLNEDINLIRDWINQGALNN